MVKLKNLMEADADEYDDPESSDKEATDYKPRSKGEQDFKKAHDKKKRVKDHPAASKDQFHGSTKEVEPEDKVGNGEMKPIPAGTKVQSFKDYSATQGPKRRGDRRQGDLKIVNPVKEDVDLSENNMKSMVDAVKNRKEVKIRFSNGDTMDVDPKTSLHLIKAYNELKDPKKKIDFRASLQKSPETFMKTMDDVLGKD